jgi:WbqC-like protein family
MNGRLTYSAHQPDLLPYSGFWYKMAKADVFDLKIWDQFVPKSYHRRVLMREQWVSLPLEKGSSTEPIFAKTLQPHAQVHLADEIVKRYTHARKKPPLWDKYGPMICDEILSIKTDKLWNLNFQLILLVRDILGITTPLTLSKRADPGLRGGAGIVNVIQSFNTRTDYLSGPGGKTYMGDCEDFKAADIPVIWSPHDPVTGDSILSVLFDYEDPMEKVLREHTPERSEGRSK